MTQSLRQIFAQAPASKTIIPVSGIGFTSVLFHFQTKATIVTDITEIHNKKTIKTFSTYHLVFRLSLGEPPKCA